MRCKKLLSCILGVSVLTLGFFPASYAAAEPSEQTSVSNFMLKNWTTNKSVKALNKTFGAIYDAYLDNNDQVKSSDVSKTFSIDANQVMEVQLSGSGAIGLTSGENSSMTFERATRLMLGMQSESGSATSPVQFSLTSPITVKKSLMIRSQYNNGKYTQFTLNQPITVANGATLLIDGSDVTGSHTQATFNPDIFVNATNGSAIKVEDGATLRIGAVSLQTNDGNTNPFIDADGGTVLIQKESTLSTSSATYDENGLPTLDSVMANDTDADAAIESNTTVIKASGDTVVEVLGGDIKMTGESTNEPAIVFEENSTGSLKLEGGTISSANGPAVTIPSGVTVEIPETSTAQITTDEEGAQAITLAQGAKVKIADTTVTVGDGENYINNDGIAVLSDGATTEDGAPMNQAIMDKDGNIYQGTETTAPTYTKTEDGAIEVTVPAGGSATVDGVTTEMPYGGTVAGDEVSVTVQSLTLNRESAYLYHNTDNNTVQLTATVDPDTIPVSWSSSDSSVASVSDNGLVTAHKDGTAVITATAGDKTATCTVNVSTYVYTGKYSYEVFTSVGDNGTISVDRYATEGDKVTIEVAPDEAYLLDELVVTANGKDVELTDNGDGTYTFTMPSADVRISATFAEDPDWTEPEEPATDVSDIFIDVAPNAWY